MKKIGIIFAMEEEINAFKEHIHIDKEKNIFIRFKFAKYTEK